MRAHQHFSSLKWLKVMFYRFSRHTPGSGPHYDTQLPASTFFFFLLLPLKEKKKDKHIIIQPQFEKSGHWHPLVKLRLKTYPRMRDLPKICQPLQCSNCWYDHSHMKNEIKPHGNLWHFYYYAMFGWKKKWRNSPSLSRASLEKLFLTFLNYAFHH